MHPRKFAATKTQTATHQNDEKSQEVNTETSKASGQMLPGYEYK